MPETEIAEETLVDEVFFASPRYEKKKGDSFKRFGDDGPYEVWNYEWDERDSFGTWLSSNSLGPVRRISIMDHNLRHYFIMGGNGVLCEIRSDIFEEPDAQIIFGGGGAWEGAYRRVVGIRFMPRGRNIPEELSSKLMEMAYEEQMQDTELAKKARGSFG